MWFVLTLGTVILELSVDVGSAVCYPSTVFVLRTAAQRKIRPLSLSQSRVVRMLVAILLIMCLCPVAPESGTAKFINTSSRKGGVGSLVT